MKFLFPKFIKNLINGLLRHTFGPLEGSYLLWCNVAPPPPPSPLFGLQFPQVKFEMFELSPLSNIIEGVESHYSLKAH